MNFLSKNLQFDSSPPLQLGTKEYIFPRKMLLPELFIIKNTALQTISRRVLFPGGSTYLLVHKYCGTIYFQLDSYWGELLSGKYLLTIKPVI